MPGRIINLLRNCFKQYEVNNKIQIRNTRYLFWEGPQVVLVLLCLNMVVFAFDVFQGANGDFVLRRPGQAGKSGHTLTLVCKTGEGTVRNDRILTEVRV